MQRFMFTIAATLIFSSVIFVPGANAGQNCADGFRSSSNKIDACTKHGGLLVTTSKTKTTTLTAPASADIPEPVSSNEPSGNSNGKIRGLCSRLNRYTPGTC